MALHFKLAGHDHFNTFKEMIIKDIPKTIKDSGRLKGLFQKTFWIDSVNVIFPLVITYLFL